MRFALFNQSGRMKLLAIENEIKCLHAGLLVRTRNELTLEQQAQLRALRNKVVPNPKFSVKSKGESGK